jgi:hypothetical protein
MEYYCKYCKYKTNIKSNYNKHLQTKKHEDICKNNKYCDICNKEFKNIRNLKRHFNTIHTDNNQKVINNISENIKSEKISYTKIKNIVDESNKEVVTVVNKAITKASALIKYLTLHHQSTPPLRKIKQKECIKFLRIDYNCPEKNNNYDLEKNFVEDFSRKLFVKNICKSILNMINYKNPDKQPIWNILDLIM